MISTLAALIAGYGWPTVLIAVGVYMLLRSDIHIRYRGKRTERPKRQTFLKPQ
jgi:hypothetical protein